MKPGTSFVAKQYNDFLAKCKDKKIRIAIDQTVIGEFYHKRISDALGVENTNRKKNHVDLLNMKSFRATKAFNKAHSDAIADLISILKYVDEVITDVSETNYTMAARLGQLLNDPVDFNDFRIENQAIQHGYWILTDDSDFNFSTGDIISYNCDLCPRT